MHREDELSELNPEQAGRALDAYMGVIVPMKRGRGVTLSKKERVAVARIVAAVRL